MASFARRFAQNTNWRAFGGYTPHFARTFWLVRLASLGLLLFVSRCGLLTRVASFARRFAQYTNWRRLRRLVRGLPALYTSLRSDSFCLYQDVVCHHEWRALLGASRNTLTGAACGGTRFALRFAQNTNWRSLRRLYASLRSDVLACTPRFARTSWFVEDVVCHAKWQASQTSDMV